MPWTFYKSDGQSMGSPGIGWTFYKADGSTLSAAATVATATLATNVTASANNSTDETVYPTFIDGATGTQGIETDTGLTYNPSTGALTSTTFVGAVTGNVTGNTSGSAGSATGNAATATALATARDIGGTSFDGTSAIAVALSAVATEATNVTASANNATDETVYPTFVDGATGTQGIETDTGLTYNPSTGALTATSFTGAVTGAVTGTASEITVSANNATDETVYPVFVDGATGSQGIESDTGLTYNPSTGVLTGTQFTGNVTGNVTGNTSGSAGSATGNAATATALATGRTIGGTSFDGTANIAVALSATTTALASARTIGGVSFDGTGNINLPGVNTAGNQATSGLAATATLAATTTALASARNIGGVSFDGTGNIDLPGVNSSGNQNTSGTAAGLSATLTVASGGTGATSLTDKAVLISQDTGTDTVGSVALTTSGQLIIGGSSGPAAATLSAGSNITITGGDGSISIAASGGGVPNPFFFA